MAPRGDILRQTGLGPIVAKRLESRVKRVMTADFLFVAQAAPAAAVLHDAEQTGFCGIDILSQHSEHVFGLGAGVLYGLGVTNSSADGDVLISPFRRFRKTATGIDPACAKPDFRSHGHHWLCVQKKGGARK